MTLQLAARFRSTCRRGRVVSSGRGSLLVLSLRPLVASCTLEPLRGASRRAFFGLRRPRAQSRSQSSNCTLGLITRSRRVRASRRRAHSRTWLCRRPPRGSFLWRRAHLWFYIQGVLNRTTYQPASACLSNAPLGRKSQKTYGARSGSVLGPRERERVRRPEGPVVAAAVAPRHQHKPRETLTSHFYRKLSVFNIKSAGCVYGKCCFF